MDHSSSRNLARLTEELHQVRRELEHCRQEDARNFEMLPLGYLILDEKGMIRKGNSVAVQMLAESHDQLCATSLIRYIARASQLVFSETKQRLFRSGKSQSLETGMVRRDGSVFWAHISMARDLNPHTEKPIARVTITDISERKQAGDDVLAHSSAIMAVFDCTPALLCILDQEQNVLFANQAMRDFLGKTVDELAQGRACEIFGCANARKNAREGADDNARGENREGIYPCALNDHCVVCELNNAIQGTLQTGIPFQEIEFTIHLLRDGVSRQAVLLAATARVVVGGQARVLLTLMDITDRHRMERNLREARERFQSLFQTIPDAVVLFRQADGLVFEVNDAFTALTRFLPSEVLGKNILELPIWENGKEREQFLEMLSSQGSCTNIQTVLRRKNAHLARTLLSARLLHLQGVPYILCVLRDISEQKQIELALAKSERQFRLLFDNNKDAIIWADFNGFVVHCNPAAEELFQRKRSELLGLHQTMLHPAEEIDSYRRLFEENTRNRNNRAVEVEIVTSSGARKPVQIFSTIIEVDGQTINQGIFVDISERVTTRKQIQYQLDLQHLLMDLSLLFLNVPTKYLDDALHEALARVGVFSRTDRVYIFAYDFVGQTMTNTHEWCAPGIEPQIRNLQNISFDASWLLIRQHRAGEPFYIDRVADLPVDEPMRTALMDQGILSVLSLPLLDGQTCIGFVGFDSMARQREWSVTEIKLFMVLAELLVNVYRRRHREAELDAARAEAERANIAKSRFLAMMSHEIRTPMNGVVGMTELLLDTDLNREQLRFAQVIHSSGEALLSLINDILDFSKIEADKLELEETLFDLRRVLEDTVRVLAVPAQTKNLRLDWQVSPDVPVQFRGDSLRLRQILLNLGANAVKFTEQGEVVIEVSRAGDTTRVRNAGAQMEMIGETEERNHHPKPNIEEPDDKSIVLLFSITDTGIGISPDKVETLFNLFHQVDASTTRKFGGTGLGLAISKRLVEMMGGRIGVRSAQGQGSTFWFTARFSDHSAEGVCDANQPAIQAGPVKKGPIPANVRVLLVDDNQINQLVARKMLQKMGITPDTAANGQEAVAAVRAKGYDLVFMDIEMPVMDGLEATAQIRRLEETTDSGPAARTPIIALTAHAVKGDRERFLAAGLDDYLTKPLRFETLAEKTRFFLAGEAVAGECEADVMEPLPGTGDAAVCNMEELLQRVMDDEELAENVLIMLLQNVSERIASIREHAAREDIRAVGEEAHGIKGTALNCSCPRLAGTARRMEEACKAEDLESLRLLLWQLEQDLREVRDVSARQAG